MSARAKVYLESTVISYLAGRPSRDLIVAAHQQLTQDWWETERARFDLFISQLVIDEISAGDQVVAQKRLSFVEGIPLVSVTEEVSLLAEQFLASKSLPAKAAKDAAHVAVATVHGLDYLMTWNCKHIANATIQRAITGVCLAAGLELPVICTPEELREEK
jgi:hypothetical protein